MYTVLRKMALAAAIALPGQAALGQDSSPTVSIASPSLGSTLSGVVTVRVNASDDVGVASVRVQHHGCVLGQTTSPPYTFYWDTTVESNEVHPLDIYVTDTAGNTTHYHTPEGYTVDNASSGQGCHVVGVGQSRWTEASGGGGGDTGGGDTGGGDTGGGDTGGGDTGGGDTGGGDTGGGTGGGGTGVGGGTGSVGGVGGAEGSNSLPLLDDLIVLGGGTTTARIGAGARLEGDAVYATEFSTGERLVIEAEFLPEEAQLQFPGDFFVVARLTTPAGDTGWFNKDEDARFQSWDGAIPSLVRTDGNDALAERFQLEVYRGALPAGRYDLFLGFEVDNTVFIYTGSPLRITVTQAD